MNNSEYVIHLYHKGVYHDTFEGVDWVITEPDFIIFGESETGSSHTYPVATGWYAIITGGP